jgi:translation initiation factor 2 subunit 3
MSGDETLQQNHDESESEEEEEEVVEVIPKIDIDPATLTPLSPEIISKQVSLLSQIASRTCLIFV